MAFSCEPKRSKAYGENLRWRIVFKHEILGESMQDISLDLRIDGSTVRRTLNRFWATGDVKRKDCPAEKVDCKLTEMAHLFLVHQLIDKPGINLRELKDSLLVELWISVTESCICKFLKKKGFSRQRMRTYALERDTELRKQFMTCLCSWMKLDVIGGISTTGKGTVLEECQ